MDAIWTRDEAGHPVQVLIFRSRITARELAGHDSVAVGLPSLATSAGEHVDYVEGQLRTAGGRLLTPDEPGWKL